MKPRIMYIEQKTGESQAWIGRVTFSKTGKTIYYKDMVFVRLKRGGIYGNHTGYRKVAYEYLVESPLILNNFGAAAAMVWGKLPNKHGEPGYLGEFWISGPKKNGQDRLYDLPIIRIDEDVREEYWQEIRKKPEMINETTC